MKKEESYEFSELSSLPESYLNTSDGGKFSVCYSILLEKRDTITNFQGIFTDDPGNETPFSRTFDRELNLPFLNGQRRASIAPDFKARAALYDKRKASLLVPSVGPQLFGRRGSRVGTLVLPIKEDWRDLTLEELEEDNEIEELVRARTG